MVVSHAAVFSGVTQRSPHKTAALETSKMAAFGKMMSHVPKISPQTQLQLSNHAMVHIFFGSKFRICTKDGRF